MPANHVRSQRQSFSLTHTRYSFARPPRGAALANARQGRHGQHGRDGQRTSFSSRPNVGPKQTGKRLLDVALAIPALLLLAPLMALIALAVRLDTPGPALFRQTRTGQGRRPFVILKFRTMRAALADRAVSDQEKSADRSDVARDQKTWGVGHAPHAFPPVETTTADGARGDGDARSFSGRLQAIQVGAAAPGITRTGRFLRASRLDELPQLFNVLRGDMSLVGPRPHMPELDALFAPALPHIYQRYAVRPGMTGLAQISGACGPTPDVRAMGLRLDNDLAYLRAWSLAGDLRLVAATPWRLLVSAVLDNGGGAPFGEARGACVARGAFGTLWLIPERRRPIHARQTATARRSHRPAIKPPAETQPARSMASSLQEADAFRLNDIYPPKRSRRVASGRVAVSTYAAACRNPTTAQV